MRSGECSRALRIRSIGVCWMEGDSMGSMISSIRKQFDRPLLPWDDYYMAMAQTDFLLGRHNLQASKTFFIREAPFGGSYAHLGGLHSFIRILEDYRFT